MPLIAVLEDDARRIVEMQSQAASELADCEFRFFTDAYEMKNWLSTNWDRVHMLSLDCDLDATALSGVGGGSGEDITAFLAECRPQFPIIIHSSNAMRAPAMHMELVLAGCTSVELWPFVDGERWGADVRRALDSSKSIHAVTVTISHSGPSGVQQAQGGWGAVLADGSTVRVLMTAKVKTRKSPVLKVGDVITVVRVPWKPNTCVALRSANGCDDDFISKADYRNIEGNNR